MSGRLQQETLDRVTEYRARIVALAEHLESEGRPRRVIDQLIGSGTAPGANLHEAHEAMSRADFIKSTCIAAKELSEASYWLKIILKR